MALQNPGLVFVTPKDGPLAIPEYAQYFLPLPDTSVRHILESTLPSIAPEPTVSSIDDPPAPKPFRSSKNAPTEPTIDNLIKHSIPSESTLKELKADVLDGQPNGVRSIAYSPGGEKSDIYLYHPLWVLTWWELAFLQTKKQQMWIRADDWLNSELQAATHPVAQRMLSLARESLLYLPWDMQIPHEAQYSSSDLTFYLSNEWLASRHIDWMLDRVTDRLPRDEYILLYSADWIKQLAWRFEAQDAPPEVISRWLSKVQDRVSKGEQPRVYSIANYGDVHWLTLEVDFEKQLVGYGDSQGGSRTSARFRRIMQSWLTQTWPGEWEEFSTEELPHGNQGNDASSCGICAINTIEARIFGHELWVPELCAAYRASKFLEMACYMIQKTQYNEFASKVVFINDELKKCEASSASRSSDKQILASKKEGMGRVPILPTQRGTKMQQGGNPSQPRLHRFFSVGSSMKKLSNAAKGLYLGRLSPPKRVQSSSDFHLGSDLDIVDLSSPETNLPPLPSTPPSPAKSPSICSSIPDAPESIASSALGDMSDNGDGSIMDEVNHTGDDAQSCATFDGSVLPSRALELPGVENTTDSNVSINASGSESSSSMDPEKPSKKRHQSARPGKSARYSRLKRMTQKAGNFEIDKSRWDKFAGTIQELDPSAEFDPNNYNRVRHSSCGKWLKMKETYNTTRFRDHVKNAACHKIAPGASKAGQKRKLSKTFGSGMKTLLSFKGFQPSAATEPDVSASDSELVQPHVKTNSKETTHVSDRACPGLSETNTHGVKAYMERSNYSGGGGKSYTYWAETLFNKKYRDLPETQKDVVKDEARAKLAWRFDGAREVIHSVSCLGNARISSQTGELLPCAECYAVTDLDGFKDALRYKPQPHQQFTNKRWMSKLSGSRFGKIQGVGELLQDTSHQSAGVRYAKRVLSGKVKKRDVFFGMLEAIGLLEERDRRQVGLQNFRWPPAYDEFCHTIASISPLAYQSFRQKLPGRTLDSFKKQRARDLRFPLGICSAVFDLAKSYLDKVGYDGPVCLACDDTKLSPALRTYYDSHTKEWKLIGGIGEPIIIANNEELVKILRSENIEKASKIRLWVIQIPLPGVPPLAIAALAIPSTIAADQLVEYLQAILDGLFSKGIQVVSYASDGSAIERRVQAMIFKTMKPREYSIPFKGALASGIIEFNLGIYNGHPIVLIQDSKHALKTCRNNLLSGARLLVLGDSCAMYSQVRDMAMDPGSTLHHRDVEKLDRQDDNAAECLFNALTLLYISKIQPHNKALAVYLYVFGELCDAYQSRHIAHSERFKMVMRARFFMENWRKYLSSAGYSHARYFISDAAYKILNELIDGLVLLIFVHRDYMPANTPLLPWLHSTEACEHFFGEMRKLVADFTHLDFIFAAPKLRVLLRASYQNYSSGLSPMQPNPRKATGYNHTYMDSSGLDLKILAHYPGDYELSQLTMLAYSEAFELALFLGCDMEIPHDYFPVLENPEFDHILPGIDSFETPIAQEMDSDADAFYGIVEHTEKAELPLEEISVPRDNLVYAAAALEVEYSLMIDNLPFETSNDIEAEQDLIRSFEGILGRDIQIPDIQEPPSKQLKAPTVDLQALVRIRKAHQNPRAWKSSKKASKWIAELVNEGAVEICSEPVVSQSNTTTDSNIPTYSELARAFAQTLRDEETAKLPDRLKRWTTTEDSSRLKGNTANAKEASDRRANEYVQSRRKYLRSTCLAQEGILEDLSTARISFAYPLKKDCIVWAVIDRKLFLAKVLALYVRGAGQNGMHLWVPNTDHLGHISHVVLQVYQKVPKTRAQFRATHYGDAHESSRYQLVSSNALVVAIPLSGLSYKGSDPSMTIVEVVGPKHLQDMNKLQETLPTYLDAMESMRKARRSSLPGPNEA